MNATCSSATGSGSKRCRATAEQRLPEDRGEVERIDRLRDVAGSARRQRALDRLREVPTDRLEEERMVVDDEALVPHGLAGGYHATQRTAATPAVWPRERRPAHKAAPLHERTL
jgi:hypothetical protein